MEPVEIVGVVAASLQFLEFGFKLVTKTIQIKGSSSGLTDENANLLDIANDLDKYADRMNKTWRDYSGKRPLGDNEKFLEEAIKDCQKISKEMQKEIRKRSHRGRNTWGAFYQAFETITKDNYVKLLATRLEAAKEKITRANLACIFDEGERSKLTLMDIQRQLEHLTRSVQMDSSQFEKFMGAACNVLDNDDPREALDIPSETIQTTWGALESSSPVMNALFEELVDKIWNPRWDVNSAKNKDEYLPRFLDNFKDHIIRSLQFHEIRKREQEIIDTFEATFEWIWATDPPEDHENLSWSSFPDWLECDKENLYWITGVPGAGKSTLMKFIQHDSRDRLVQHLAKWEPDSSLLLLHYYAWNAGMDELKSREGLLRTILAQGLEAEPDIVPSVAKRRLALFGTLSPKALRDFQLLPQKPWRLDELRECLQSFVQELDCRKKLVIFVDGLDEFEIPPQKVVAQIQDLLVGKRTKVCVASRPWIEFEKALMPCPHLRIDELTSEDISAYIKGKLELLPEFSERDFEVSDLTKQIREKAQGVFLWVALVVEHMLPGLEAAKSLSALQKAIDKLPTEIRRLYDAIWRRIPEELKQDASKLVRLFCASHSRTDMLRMWLAYEGKTPSYKFEPQEDRYTAIRSMTIRRLNSHARGILKLSDTDEVTVPHKTAYEWMLQTEVQNEIFSSIPPLFNPVLRWMNASIISFNCCKKKAAKGFLKDALKYACGTCSPNTVHQKHRELGIASADDIVRCFNELATLAKSWELPNSIWNAQMEKMCIPSFICLMAHLVIIDYLRSLSRSDPGIFFKGINLEYEEDEGMISFGRLITFHEEGLEGAEHYLWAKLECVKLFLSVIPGERSEAYLSILKCGMLATMSSLPRDFHALEERYYHEVLKCTRQCAKERGFGRRLEIDIKPGNSRILWVWGGKPFRSRRRQKVLDWLY